MTEENFKQALALRTKIEELKILYDNIASCVAIEKMTLRKNCVLGGGTLIDETAR